MLFRARLHLLLLGSECVEIEGPALDSNEAGLLALPSFSKRIPLQNLVTLKRRTPMSHSRTLLLFLTLAITVVASGCLLRPKHWPAVPSVQSPCADRAV